MVIINKFIGDSVVTIIHCMHKFVYICTSVRDVAEKNGHRPISLNHSFDISSQFLFRVTANTVKSDGASLAGHRQTRMHLISVSFSFSLFRF